MGDRKKVFTSYGKKQLSVITCNGKAITTGHGRKGQFMIKCASCGAENSSYSIYCKGCGAVLSSIDSVPDDKEEKISVPARPAPAEEIDEPKDDGFRYIATDKNDKGSYTYDPSRDRTLRPDYVPEDHSADTWKAILIVGMWIAIAVAAVIVFIILS